MKKIIIIVISAVIILFVIFLILIKRENIIYHPETIVEDNKNYVISITFPKTNISRLDKLIILVLV